MAPSWLKGAGSWVGGYWLLLQFHLSFWHSSSLHFPVFDSSLRWTMMKWRNFGRLSRYYYDYYYEFSWKWSYPVPLSLMTFSIGYKHTDFGFWIELFFFSKSIGFSWRVCLWGAGPFEETLRWLDQLNQVATAQGLSLLLWGNIRITSPPGVTLWCASVFNSTLAKATWEKHGITFTTQKRSVLFCCFEKSCSGETASHCASHTRLFPSTFFFFSKRLLVWLPALKQTSWTIFDLSKKKKKFAGWATGL